MKREIIIALIVIFAGTAVALLPTYVTVTGQVTVSDACGSGNVLDEEQCEFPSTDNNEFCSQTTSECEEGFGPKTRTRDSVGACNSECSCVQDEFGPFVCLEGSCSAECDSNDDCPASECSVEFPDFCGPGNQLTEYDNDKVLDSTLVQNSIANTCDVQNTCGCSSNPVSCDAPQTNTYCVEGICGAVCDENSDCQDNIQNDICFFSGTCDLESSCSCSYQQEFCPAPGTIDENTCYYGTQGCGQSGCYLNTCQLQQGDTCEPDTGCTPPAPVCGNGNVESGEQCDDGNTNNADECTNECTLTFCGDGSVQTPNSNQQVEQCDDGNTENGDGCDESCQEENGV